MGAGNHRQGWLAVSLSLLLMTACTGQGSDIARLLPFLRGGMPTGNNRPPVIQSLQVPELAGIKAGGPLPLSVTAQDPDGDPLTIAWFCSSGKLASPMGDKTVWHPDATPGDFYLAAAVADGRGGATLQVRDLHVAADGTMTWGATREQWPADASPLPIPVPSSQPSASRSAVGASATPAPTVHPSITPTAPTTSAVPLPPSANELVLVPYVVQESNQAVTATGVVRAPIATMSDIAIGPKGSLYVADQTAGGVYRVTAGTVARLPGTIGVKPSAIAVGPDGELVIADPDSRKVLRIAEDGTATSLLDNVTTIVLNAMATDGVGTVHASLGPYLYRLGRDGTVRKSSFFWSADNVRLGAAVDGPEGNGGYCRAPDAQGRMVFAMDGRLFRLEANDTLTYMSGMRASSGMAINATGHASTIDPKTMAFTAKGDLYYSDGMRFYRLAADDSLHELELRFEGLPDMTTRRWGPRRLAISTDGTLYVSESTNNIVWKAQLP